MKRRFLIILTTIIFCLLNNIVFSENIYNSFSLPQINAILELYTKDIYYSGEILNVTVEIMYNAPYYLPDSLLVIQLIKIYEDGPIYPADIIDHNVFYEKVFYLNLKPNDIIYVNFNYTIPKDIENGTYYVVAYLYTPLSYILGLPFIFLPGNYKKITIISNNLEEGYPYVRIYRKESKINYDYPTVGAFATNNINLEIAILSDIDTEAELLIKYAPWDDVSRKTNLLSRKKIKLSKGLNYVNITQDISQLDPNVYSIRVEVYLNESLQSLYRFRFIKSGPTAILRGILLDRNRNLLVIVGPSPDHYLYPVTEDVILVIKSNELNYNKEIYIGNLEYFSTGFIYVNLSLSDITKENFDLCAYLYSKNKLTDSYCIFYSNVKPKPKVEIIVVNNTLKINSTVSGTLILDYLDKDKTYSYSISPGLNTIFVDSGKYFITFISDEIYLEKELEVHPKKENIFIRIFEERVLLILILIILLVLILIIVRILKTKTNYLKILMFYLVFVLLFEGVYSFKIRSFNYPNITLEDEDICSINGTLNIYIDNHLENYNVTVNIYDKINLIYTQKYVCLEEDCEIISIIPYLPPKNYTLNIIIEKDEEIFEKNFTLSSLFPYNINLLYSTIYIGAKTAVVIENVGKCQNLRNYTGTRFNFVYNISTQNYSILRQNCPYSGDIDWGERICGIDPSSLSAGTYYIFANYTIDNFTFLQFVGSLKLIEGSYYVFSNLRCRHAWSAQGLGAQYRIRIKGRYTIDENMYILANNSIFSIENINSINYLCSNGVLRRDMARIFGFVYQYSDIESINNYSQGKFIYGKDNSINNFSEEVGNIMIEIYRNNRRRGFTKRSGTIYQSFDLYKFESSGYYGIITNQINARCDSPIVYVCPATEEESNLCRIGIYNTSIQYTGWIKLNEYKIVVPYPDIVGTYTELIEGYPYFDKTTGKWYLYVTNYKLTNYKERLNYTIQRQVPLDSIIVGRFRNVGYGKLNVSIVGKDFRFVRTIKDKEIQSVYVNLTDYILKNCRGKECSIKFDIKYIDAYNLTREFYLADPYINIRLNNISVNIISPGYLRGILIVVPLNITNNGPIEAQNVGLISFNYSKCLDIIGEKSIDIPSNEYRLYNVFVILKDLNCQTREYIVNLKVGGDNTFHKEVTLNVQDYLNNILHHERKIEIEEKINIILILLILIILIIL